MYKIVIQDTFFMITILIVAKHLSLSVCPSVRLLKQTKPGVHKIHILDVSICVFLINDYSFYVSFETNTTIPVFKCSTLTLTCYCLVDFGSYVFFIKKMNLIFGAIVYRAHWTKYKTRIKTTSLFLSEHCGLKSINQLIT